MESFYYGKAYPSSLHTAQVETAPDYLFFLSCMCFVFSAIGLVYILMESVLPLPCRLVMTLPHLGHATLGCLGVFVCMRPNQGFLQDGPCAAILLVGVAAAWTIAFYHLVMSCALSVLLLSRKTKTLTSRPLSKAKDATIVAVIFVLWTLVAATQASVFTLTPDFAEHGTVRLCTDIRFLQDFSRSKNLVGVGLSLVTTMIAMPVIYIAHDAWYKRRAWQAAGGGRTTMHPDGAIMPLGEGDYPDDHNAGGLQAETPDVPSHQLARGEGGGDEWVEATIGGGRRSRRRDAQVVLPLRERREGNNNNLGKAGGNHGSQPEGPLTAMAGLAVEAGGGFEETGKGSSSRVGVETVDGEVEERTAAIADTSMNRGDDECGEEMPGGYREYSPTEEEEEEVEAEGGLSDPPRIAEMVLGGKGHRQAVMLEGKAIIVGEGTDDEGDDEEEKEETIEDDGDDDDETDSGIVECALSWEAAETQNNNHNYDKLKAVRIGAIGGEPSPRREDSECEIMMSSPPPAKLPLPSQCSPRNEALERPALPGDLPSTSRDTGLPSPTVPVAASVRVRAGTADPEELPSLGNKQRFVFTKSERTDNLRELEEYRALHGYGLASAQRPVLMLDYILGLTGLTFVLVYGPLAYHLMATGNDVASVLGEFQLETFFQLSLVKGTLDSLITFITIQILSSNK